MARPQKAGLEYFPLDVEMDDNVTLIEAAHGIVGFGVFIKLYQKIYSEGYFYSWTEKEQLLFSNKVSVDRNLVISIVSDCIKWGLFDQNLYRKYQILTSKGIQKRYITAIYKRNKVEMIKEYLLINVTDRSNVIYISVSDDGNNEPSMVSDSSSTQSKVKESKVKESKEESDSLSTQSIELCQYYETLKPGQSITAHIDSLKIMIDLYTFEWCKEALQITVSNKKQFIKAYMEGILLNWQKDGKVDIDTSPKVKSFKAPVTTFNSYDQRSYDIKELEKNLFGVGEDIQDENEDLSPETLKAIKERQRNLKNTKSTDYCEGG